MNKAAWAATLSFFGMPGMDGYEVARHVHGEADVRHVVLIALSGSGQHEDRERSRSAGYNNHPVKPLNPVTLPTLLTSLVDQASPLPR